LGFNAFGRPKRAVKGSVPGAVPPDERADSIRHPVAVLNRGLLEDYDKSEGLVGLRGSFCRFLLPYGSRSGAASERETGRPTHPIA
jgi:hypothetical protein